MIPVLDKMSDEKRRALALRVHDLKDFTLPELKYWNYEPCDRHDEINQWCQQCGILFLKHQRVGIAWLYFVKKGLLADSVGLGKMVMGSGLLALMKEAGEVTRQGTLIVSRASAAEMWNTELHRMLKDFGDIKTISGPRKKRVEKYLSQWDVGIISSDTFIRDLDVLLELFPVRNLIIDDVDPLLNNESKTAYSLKKLAEQCSRVAILTATPLQKRLPQLHSVLEPLGGRDIFGSPKAFEREYIRKDKIYIALPDTALERNRKKIVEKVVGFKNLSVLNQKLKPVALRRTASDVDDINLPAINPVNEWLEFTPAQRRKYKELQTGILKIIKAEGTKVKRTEALAQLLYGAQICTGLASLGEDDLPNTSCKLDWIEDKLVDGDLSDEKVVVFMRFKNSIRAMAKRLERAGIGYEIIWGEQPDKKIREQSRQRFWNDDNCKVLLGTQSLEQSLNLQCARHLINADMIMNPARMQQLAGRIRRAGSRFESVWVHNLLVRDSQEERYLPALQREQAMIDAVWNEESELFEKLDPLALMRLITG